MRTFNLLTAAAAGCVALAVGAATEGTPSPASLTLVRCENGERTTLTVPLADGESLHESADGLAEILGRSWRLRGSTPSGLRRAEAQTGFTFGLDTVGSYAVVLSYAGDAADVTIPDEIEVAGRTYPVTVIYSGAFSSLGDLATVRFGANVSTIRGSAFVSCPKLSAVVLNEGLERIETRAFGTGCRALTHLDFPSTLACIGPNAFPGAAISGEVALPASLREFGAGAFAGNPVSGFTVAPGNTAYSAADGVLYGDGGGTLVCWPEGKKAASADVPAGVTRVEASAFMGAAGVEAISLPASVAEIGDQAFYGTGTRSVTLGAGVRTVGNGIVGGDARLETIAVDPANPCYEVRDGYLLERGTGRLAASVWRSGAVDVPDGVAAVGALAFYGNAAITSVRCPVSVTEIGASAFYQCTSLKSVSFPGVVRIGSLAFSRCTSLESPAFPATLRAIGSTAFSRCGSITSVVLPEGLDTIGRTAFYMCSSLARIEIPGSVRSFGDAICFYCPELTEARLGEGLAEIPDQLFNMCSALARVNIPSTVRRIERSAFYNNAFTSIALPAGLEMIGYSALYGTGITTLDIPDNVKFVDDFGCAFNRSLRTVRVGGGCRSLRRYAFHSCDGATSVTLPEGLDSIGTEAFSSTRSLRSFDIPSTVTAIGEGALWQAPLITLVNRATVPQRLDTTITGNPYEETDIYSTCTLLVPAPSLDAYRSADIWRLFGSIESNGVGVAACDDAEIVEIYSPDGTRLPALRRGVNVCRMSDGTTVKVFRR